MFFLAIIYKKKWFLSLQRLLWYLFVKYFKIFFVLSTVIENRFQIYEKKLLDI